MKKLVFLSLLVIMTHIAYAQASTVAPSATTAIPDATVPSAAPVSVSPTTSAPATPVTAPAATGTTTKVAIPTGATTVTTVAAPATTVTATPVSATVTSTTTTTVAANQPASAAATTPAQDSFSYDSDHYSVRSYVSVENAQAIAERLEAYQTIFNRYFHFDTDKLGLKLKVRIFASKPRFDQYLQKLINETRDDFVYLHYSDAGRSELIGYADADKPAPEESIAHQSFIQFLRAYIPNPPLWLREGFAVYFEGIAWNPDTKTAELHENLAWLETYKDLAFGARTSEAIPLTDLLTLNVDKAREKIQVFYPQAWALIDYLAHTDVKNHNRILWDAIAQLSPSANLDENSRAILDNAFKWETTTGVIDASANYFKEKKTYRELVQSGIDLYTAGKAKESEAAFTQALGLQDASFVPYYYLGLINYDKGSYAQAESFYQKALDKGASPALTNYALGVNAFADNRFDVAKQFLKKTSDLDPSFKDKVADLLQRMES